jgi:hypothetical protein
MRNRRSDEDGGAALRWVGPSRFRTTRAALARVATNVPRRIADPMTLVCSHHLMIAADTVRNRLPGRPSVNRATTNNETKRSSYR